jgi:phosphatidylglycerol---prolipoprotein diacylglyceryl transferase
MLPVLQIGPLALQTPGLILLLGIWIGLWLSERYSHRTNLDASHIYNLVMIALLFGLLGGRVFFIARYPEAFLSSPASMLSINPSLFDVPGALLSGLLAAMVYGGRKKLPFWKTLDTLTPGFAVFAISLALANLASGNGFGSSTQVPWAIEVLGTRRHPSQIYESLSAALILVYVLSMQRSTRSRTPGYDFLSYISLSAGARLFLEAFRGDSLFLSNGFRTAQVVAWIVLAVSIWLISRRKATISAPVHKGLEENGHSVG